jgi:hypothetical protein
MQPDQPVHLTQYQLCKRWEVKKRTLERWRALRCGPPYIKVGARILYPIQEIVAFEQENFIPTTKRLPQPKVSNVAVGGLL